MNIFLYIALIAIALLWAPGWLLLLIAIIL